MERAGDLLRRRFPELRPTYDPDYLRRLPPTETLAAGLADLRARAAGCGADGADAPQRLLVEIGRFERAVAAAEERDRLGADRPAGCWCLGAGGRGARAVVRPDAGGEMTRRQDGTESPIFGVEDTAIFLDTYCPCPEGEARKAADDAVRAEIAAELRRRRAERRLAEVWSGMNIPLRFDGCTLDSYPVSAATAEALRTVRAWPASASWCLVLSGPYSVGKTGLSVGLLRVAGELGLPGLFVKVPDLLSRWRATFVKGSAVSEEDVLATLREVPYLVLDDLGADKESDWAKTALFQVIDDRHDNERKTVITTNLGVPGELGLHLGKRTMNRFLEGTVMVPLDGPNLRLQTRAA